MPHISNDIVGQLFTPFFVWFFFIFGLVGLAVGAGLAICGSRLHKFFNLTNRWVSTRRSFKRRWVGALFIAGGAFPLFTLVHRLYESSFELLLGGAIQSRFIAWGVQAVWWFLTLGNLFAIVVGAMLLFSPTVLESISNSLGRRVVMRQPEDAGEGMYLTLDRWIESFPRLAGSLIAAGALVVVLQFGLVLFGMHR